MFGVASSAITATHSVVIKQSLPIVDGSALLLSWYTNLLSAVALAPIVLLAGEGGAVLDLLAGNLVNTRVDGGMGPTATFLWGSIITVSSSLYHKVSYNFFLRMQGAVGFLMSIASLLSIKVTSPITHMVSSAVRGVAASLLGVWIFHDIITRYN
jgi:GDP-fucose transporter C1